MPFLYIFISTETEKGIALLVQVLRFFLRHQYQSITTSMPLPTLILIPKQAFEFVHDTPSILLLQKAFQICFFFSGVLGVEVYMLVQWAKIRK